MPLNRLDKRSTAILMLTFIAAAFAVAGAFSRYLYLTSLDEQAAWLEKLVQSQVGIVTAVAKFDAQNSPPDYPGSAAEATLSQLLDAYKDYTGFGQTGEFVIGRRQGDMMVFLDTRRPQSNKIPDPIPFNATVAEPLRRALKGQSGTLIGIDHSGMEVLAAYSPIPELGIGIVAKVDLTEVKAPYIRLALLNGIVLFVVILGSGWLTYRLYVPLLTRLEQQTAELEKSNRELHQQTEVLEGLTDKLRYEVGVKNRFFSIISHDLRSPFNALLGMTQMMSQQSSLFSKEKMVEFAGDVNESATRVFRLLENLLEWARLQMEDSQLRPTETVLKTVVQFTNDVLRPVAEEKKVRLENKVSTETVFADPAIVDTVLRNLISNAIKFSQPDGSVEISAQTNGEMTQVLVRDNGVGIPDSLLPQLFDLDQITTTPGTAGEIGSGLGLPLCKDLLEKSDGRIWIEQKSSAGTDIWFELPAKDQKSGETS
ncbi:ATP-binding protein [Rhodovibrionaceae bacterium A322]